MISNTRNDLISKEQFNFNAEHNGVQCIESLKPEDRGTRRQFWFTAAMLAVCFNCTVNTIKARVEALIDTGELTDVRNLTSVMLKDSLGRECVKTTLYDLEVFNKLAMTFIDSPKAVEIRQKFSDVLVKHETGTVVALPDFNNPAVAARAWADAWEAKENAQKALEAEKAAHAKDNQDFCEGLKIIEKKARQISTKREITAMNTASKKARECKALTLQNINYKNENAVLRDAVGRGQNWRTISAMTSEWQKSFGHAPSWQKLMLFSKALNDAAKMPIRDVHETIVLKNGTTKDSISYRYHIEAWNLYKIYENT